LIAAVLVATGGIALITLLGQTAHSLRSVVTTERFTQRAAEQLDKLALLDQRALGERVGMSRIGDLTLRIEEIAPGLFDAAVAPSDTSAPLLTTTLYRPDSNNAVP
jgi:hypothetical protein